MLIFDCGEILISIIEKQGKNPGNYHYSGFRKRSYGNYHHDRE